MASITFTHAIAGAVTLQSSWPEPANRFQNWTPFVRSVGEGAHALGDGLFYKYEHRPEAGASFELAGLNNDTDLDAAQLLIHHLLSGGTCTVVTDDSQANTYATCGLAPDTTPEITFDDRGMLEYRLHLALINVDPTLTLMQCVY